MKYFCGLLLFLILPVTLTGQNLLPPIHNYKIFDYTAASKNWSLAANGKGELFAPDKLYSSWLVYDTTSVSLRSLNSEQNYYFAVEAFNENGVGERTPVAKVV